MKWLICAMFGAVIGYYVFRAQNAAVHGELALELHRNIVLADRAEKAETAAKWMEKQLDALLVIPQPPHGDGATVIPRMFISVDGKEA